MSCSGTFGTVTEDAIDEEGRRPPTGGVDQVLDNITRLRGLGFTNLVFPFGTADTSNASVLERIDLVGELVLSGMTSHGC